MYSIDDYSNLRYKLSNKFSCVNSMYTQEDLIQEFYFPFNYCTKTYDPNKGMKFLSYLTMATTHHYLKCLNTKNKGINDTISFSTPYEEDTTLEDLLGVDDNIEEVLFQLELKQLLEDKLKTLKEKEVEILKYRYYHNLSFLQIAYIYGCTRNNIIQYHNNSMRKLRRDVDLVNFYRANINPNY